MSASRVLFRCDASPTIGAGHATRCLALAEALRDRGCEVRIAVAPGSRETAPVLTAADGIDVRVLNDVGPDELAAMQRPMPQGCDLLVIDHYGRDVNFEANCRKFAERIVVLDDGTGVPHDCDFLVDAAAPGPEVYAGLIPANTRLLTGPRFALLRRAFVERRVDALARRDGRPVENILVSFGAADPHGTTARVLELLAGVAPQARIIVVLSSQAPNLANVKCRVDRRTQLMLDVLDMPSVMTEADVAVGAPGATAYERASLGLPTVLVTIARNQHGIRDLMVEARAAFDGSGDDETADAQVAPLVARLIGDATQRIEMALAASRLIDGGGAARVAEALI
jgi:UDP-2,4-diacetamido-2,4,6-trideoxy-beta-L-altropyranose hydrolase